MQAFTLAPIREKISTRVECIDAWGDEYLVAGMNDGCLLLFRVAPNSVRMPSSDQYYPGMSANSGPQYTAHSMAPARHYPRHPIVQVAAAETLGILAVLPQDGPVAIHNLDPQGLFNPRQPLTKTRGCTYFSLFCNVVLPSVSGPTCVLVAACKKSIVIYRWDAGHGQFVEYHEYSSVDPPRSFAWADDSILVGTKREYYKMSLPSGTKTTLFQNGKATANPCATRTPDDFLLVLREQVSVFLNKDGGAARQHGVSWDEVPVDVVCAPPFLLAALSKYIQVRMSSEASVGFGQMLPIKGAKSVISRPILDPAGRPTGEYVLYAATPDSIYRLVPVPLRYQIQNLTRTRDYETAITLCECLPTNDPERESIMCEVRKAQAYNHFAQGQYRPAFDAFTSLRTNIFEVLSLIPNVLPNDLKRTVKCPIDTTELTGAPLTNAMRFLVKYLEAMRPIICTEHEKALSFERAEAECDSDYSTIKLESVVLDTSIVRVCTQIAEDNLLNSVVRGPNCCHVKETQDILMRTKYFKELIELYFSKHLHSRAIKLLMTPNGPLNEAHHTINYLRRLTAQDRGLILDTAKRLLNAYNDKNIQEQVLTIFTEPVSKNPQDDVPHRQVYEFLKQFAPNVVIQYLEFAIQNRDDHDQFIHNELAFQYIARLRELLPADISETRPYVTLAVNEKDELGRVRRALITFLETSQYYQPAEILSKGRIPPNALFEERCVLMSKTGKHQSALQFYVLQLKSFEMAERYCQMHYDKEGETKQIYLDLLTVYLANSDNGKRKDMVEPALTILEKYYQYINISEALSKLPSSLSLSELMPFFERVLSESARKRRDSQMIRSLYRNESLRVRQEYIEKRSPCVFINRDVECSVCQKALRSSAFARFPKTGQVVHLMCMPRMENYTPDPETAGQSTNPFA